HFHHHVRSFIRELFTDGIEGFMTRAVESPADTMGFKSNYDPQSIVDGDYPENTVNFDYGGAYSTYNWELFFHLPMLIAGRLQLDQQFDKAQDWYHYVFDPTQTGGGDKQRFWVFKPFWDQAGKQIQTLEELLADSAELEEQVEKWEDNPFEPHVIARI